MFFNIVSLSEVRPGDHLCRYRWSQVQGGIAVQYSKLSSIFVITTYKNTLRLVPLKEFKGHSFLRRVTHKQEISHCLPPDEIAQNAVFLLEWIKTSPDCVRALFANDLSQFAQRCCTTAHKQWQNLFHSTPKKHLAAKKQGSHSNDVFNLALLCGMSFHRASQIGTRTSECAENQPLLVDEL